MNRYTLSTPRTFTCGRCSLLFPTFESLQRHVDDARHFRCTARFCQKDFNSRQALVAHRSTCRAPPLARIPNDSPYPMTPIAVDIPARRQLVLELTQRPEAYSPDGKQRFIYMDTDNIIFSMLNSPHLHPLVGASFSNALRLHFDKFTQRVCHSAKGAKSPYVQMLSATYVGAAQVLAQSLVRCGWSVAKRDAVTETDLSAMLTHAQRRESGCQEDENSQRTLVLVTGDAKLSARHHGSSFRAVALQYLDANWNVEIHAWAHSIHDGFIQLTEQYPTQCLVRLIDDTDDISALVYAGAYNPWQQAPLVPQALPSPVFHSQPPSPAHSMASVFDFDVAAPAVVHAQLLQENRALTERVRALEAQLVFERAANQQLVGRTTDQENHARVVAALPAWSQHVKAVRSS